MQRALRGTSCLCLYFASPALWGHGGISKLPRFARDFELWVISPNVDAPVSLGVIPTDQESLFEITPEIAALIDGGVLAVSNEPTGGSPTGAPTGAILATDEFFDADLFQAG